MLNKKGYSVIEVLLAGSILALAVTGIVAAILLAQRNNQSNVAQSQALEMAKEGMNALISIRDRDYTQLLNTASGALKIENGQWVIIANPIYSDDQLTQPNRTRRISIADSIDTPNAKTVAVKVTYQINPEGDSYTVTLSETLVNLLGTNAVGNPGGFSAKSKNYRLIDDGIGSLNNKFE